MRKLSMLVLGGVICFAASAQRNFWSANKDNQSKIPTDKAVARLSYPKEFKLFNVDAASLRQDLFAVAGPKRTKGSTVISIPNADGGFEQFEVVEASNFEPALQAQFPEIRSFSGKGITDKYATLKLSISPQGIQTMVFRTEEDNEFIEPYSKDHTVYSAYRAKRDKGKLPWTCTTTEKQMASDISSQINPELFAAGTSTGQLKTMRLAQSCNAEYANYFGATSSAQVALVLAAFNATLTRCNGVYEKDLALHLNLIANTTAVIYYNPATDPYSTNLSSWNNQLQSTLTSVIGDANYDIGHMFGATGGGGNAGCIGCVCNSGKGSGITSPADGIPQGDNFDIDYVVHEVGHQLGANHTFSMSSEGGTGVQKEIGSGITIMGYAGITAQDVAPHSIDIFHEASIAQIQANLAGKTCPISTNITANNVAPVIGAVSNYTIPISTPFALSASATDANGDALTYCWEQNDNSTTTGASSVASATKATGPNWISFSPTTSSTRLFPKLSTILAGALISGPLPGGDAAANTEALSSVSRTLNFRLTVRDNHAFSSSAPVAVGQTAFTDVVVTVSNTSGPFAVTAPNTAVTWGGGSTQNITWSVAGTTGAPVSCANVKISLSTDGGQTFPTVLVASTPNDGSEALVIPATPTTTARVKVEAVGNIFFDISNTNFTIGGAVACGDPAGLASSAVTQTAATVGWGAVSGAVSYDVDYKAASSGTWLPVAAATTSLSANVSGLTAGTLYDWRVRTNCSFGSSSYSTAQFTTTSASSPCPGVYDVSTNGTTGGAATIPLNTDVKGTVSVRNDTDIYKFVITTGGTITLTLTTLPANYDLSLLNSSGTQLASSTKTGTNSESINRTVTAGTYYARVTPKNTANNATVCYTLKVATGTASRSTAEEDIEVITLKAYPNPAKSTVNIMLPRFEGTATINMYDTYGRSVMQKNTNQQSNRIGIGALPLGVYMIKARSNGNDLGMAKIVKE